MSLEVIGADETCCAEFKEEVPDCMFGKSFILTVPKGGVCSGSLCEFQNKSQNMPFGHMDVTSIGVYQLSAACCTTVQQHPDPAPACMPQKICEVMRGMFTGSPPSTTGISPVVIVLIVVIVVGGIVATVVFVQRRNAAADQGTGEPLNRPGSANQSNLSD